VETLQQSLDIKLFAQGVYQDGDGSCCPYNAAGRRGLAAKPFLIIDHLKVGNNTNERTHECHR